MLEIDAFGENVVFDHIGLAVRSIKDSIKNDLDVINEDIQKVSVAFINMNGLRVELIEPLGEDTPVSASLQKGQQLVHLCFRVPDVETAIKKAREHNFHCIANPVSAKAFGGRRIAWLFSKIYGLVELVEDGVCGDRSGKNKSGQQL